jgi:hypothetical protein
MLSAETAASNDEVNTAFTREPTASLAIISTDRSVLPNDGSVPICHITRLMCEITYAPKATKQVPLHNGQS